MSLSPFKCKWNSKKPMPMFFYSVAKEKYSWEYPDTSGGAHLLLICLIVGVFLGCLTMFLAEKLRMGSSAASETELSMMKMRMRLVKIWWLMSRWHATRILRYRQRPDGQQCVRMNNVAMQKTSSCLHRWCLCGSVLYAYKNICCVS